MQLFSNNASLQRHQLIYNLAPVGNKIILPEAYLVAVSDSGELTYLLRRVQQNNVVALGYPLEAERATIFEIIERLRPNKIEERYNVSQKRPLKLAQLLTEDETKGKLIRYVDREMANFLKLVRRSGAHITWDGQKKVKLADMEVLFAEESLKAHAAFKRTDDGMHYRLRLEDKNGIFRVRNQDIRVLTNEPAWLLMNLKIYRLEHINGNMTKAFMTKNVVPVPERHIKTYFNFVRKVATKINIEAEGFAILEENVLQAAVLKLERNIFDKRFGVKLLWRYTAKDFHWQDDKAQTVAVDFGVGNEDISIRKIIRDFKTESNYLATLERLNIRVGDDNLFRPFSTVAAPPIDIPLWFIRQKSTLVEAGFLVEDIRIGDKSIVSNLPKISFAQTGGLDWLDIHGMVTVGKFTFKFLKLANYIRTSDPFFPLPDGTYFIIPQEWMTRYKGLIQFGTLKDERLRIHKSQYGVLQGLAVDGLDTEQFIEKVVYQPSKLLKAKLRPYQLEGVQWLVNHHQNNYGALLADDMGLGKTLQTIALLLYASEQKTAEATTEEVTAADLFHTIEHRVPLQALIILPTSLIYNWENEIRKFAPALLTYQHVGAKRHKDLKLLRRFDVLLTTYQTALRDVELLRQVRWEYVILDESQYIKNKNSKIFKAISQIESEHRLSLSGTPIENSLSDLWAQMHFINPKLIGSFTNFKREFITPIEKQDNKEKVGFLRDLVAPFLLRRTKQMVAKDLPELTEQIFYSTMTGEQKKMYEEAKSAARNFLLEEVDSRAFNYQSIVLQTLNKLRQIVNHPVLVQPDFTGTSAKFDDVLAQLGKLERGAHKTLMFSSFLRYLNLFQTEFEQQKTPYALLNGQLTRKQRQHHIDKFMQNKEVRHFLISLKAGATGLNLTAADYVLLLDPWYNPFAENQAIARAHRIGQLRQVISLKFITKDTIEEKILALQQRKAQLAADIIGTSKLRYSKEDLSFLLQ